MDEIFIVKAVCEAECKIQRSIFRARLIPCQTAEEAKAAIRKVSEEHRTANHHCWAYILGEKGEVFHFSDAGEPSGTAGKPILNSLRKHRLTFVAAVVTRWFGGIKLGVRGLIEAYGDSVELAIQGAETARYIPTDLLTLRVGYDLLPTLRHRLQAFQATEIRVEYDADVRILYEVESAQLPELLGLLRDGFGQGKVTIETQSSKKLGD